MLNPFRNLTSQHMIMTLDKSTAWHNMVNAAHKAQDQLEVVVKMGFILCT